MSLSRWLTPLPQPLQARVRAVHHQDPTDTGPVVYWMRSALRSVENPALDVALALAQELSVPLEVVVGVDIARLSQRSATFLAEALPRLVSELQHQGAQVSVSTRVDDEAVADLAHDCGLLLVEEYPVAGADDQLRAAGQWARTGVWAVDAACVVPRRQLEVQVRPERYAEAHRRRLASALSGWARPAPLPPRVEEVDLPALVSRWWIAPSFSLRGSERPDDALRALEEERYWPLLHLGMVSPFAVARALQTDPEAYDRAIVQREMALRWLSERDEPLSLAMLPEWARVSMERHGRDHRPKRCSLEQVVGGETGDAQVDRATAKLVREGWLTPTERRGWMRGLLRCTRSGEEAYALARRITHRFAVDGGSPEPYLQLLEGLGLFQRPAVAPRPIVGALPEPHRPDVWLPPALHTPRVAVVGAGVAGATVARGLAQHGLQVVVFDKGRGPGGRLSTRRQAGERFDHGAPVFTARSERFEELCRSWEQEGALQAWYGRFGRWERGPVLERSGPRRYVGMPRMSQLIRHLLRGLDVRFEHRVEAAQQTAGQWALRIADVETLEGPFDAVVWAIPAPQFLERSSGLEALAGEVARIRYSPVWVTMVAATTPLDVPLDGIRFGPDDSVQVAVRESAKPGRAPGERWVLHGSPQFSDTHLEVDADEVAASMLDAFCAQVQIEVPMAATVAHRWRYGRVVSPLGSQGVFSEPLAMGFCGDGCLGGRVEDAVASARWMVMRMVRWARDAQGRAPAPQLSLL